MKRRPRTLGAAVSAVALLGAGSAEARSAVLDDLLTFHPGWVTRSVTSHDPTGGNGDNTIEGIGAEREHRVLFHEKGEGRIVRMWMTSDRWEDPGEYGELWILVDGQTAYRGSPIDFFKGRGPWQAPLVLDREQSSGAFTSHVPFPYSREAKVLFRGNPKYFQVTYREGPGAAAGPTAAELRDFLAEDWAGDLAAALPAPRPLRPGEEITVATGPVTVDALALQLAAGAAGGARGSLRGVSIRVGDQPPVPASFFFGLASAGDELDQGWATLRSAVHAVDADRGALFSRLPVPLRAGEGLRIVAGPEAEPDLAVAWAARTAPARPGVRLVAQYRDQRAPGTETSMPLFEHPGPVQVASVIQVLTESRPGDRSYLEGDELVRTDGMEHPTQIGTGMEDFYNGGWYFLGPHANPLSGMPRFVVNDPEDGWSHARFELSLYRHFMPDPIVGRAGVRLGLEAGGTGAYTPLRSRSLALAYAFDAPVEIGRELIAPGGDPLRSAWDAERSTPLETRSVRAHRGSTELRFACPGGRPAPDGMLLVRTYDAFEGGQEAEVLVSGRRAGVFFDAYRNRARRFAQSAVWIDLEPGDCQDGSIAVRVDASRSQVDFTEIAYEARLFRAGDAPPALRTGEPIHILDTREVPVDPARPGGPAAPYYVLDHTAIQDDQGAWHLYGIFHPEPHDPEDERELMHATCAEPDPARWGPGACRLAPGPARIARSADPRAGERVLWAPQVARDDDGSFLMAVHAGLAGNDDSRALIKTLRSRDLDAWQRAPSALAFEDVCVARDPMLLRTGTLWIMYYTRCDAPSSQRSGVAYRTSTDGVRWSEPAMALTLADTPPLFNAGYAESPFVFERGGWFYLSVTSYPVAWDATFVYRSRSPFDFSGRPPIARLPAKAAEWIAAGGDLGRNPLFMTHSGPGQGGLWLIPVSGI